MSELEQRAERAVRRGELLAAIEHFEAHLAQHPEDDRVRARMEAVRALLQPSEMVSRRRTEPDDAASGGTPASDAEIGEMHAGSGRFAEAAQAYERAVAANPGNELLRERLAELRGLVVPAGKADLAALEKLDGPAPAAGNGSARPERSARAHAASFAPLSPEKPLPREPKAMLEELLQRVRSGRRS